MERLNGLDLFSGYGGLTLALKKWVRPVAYCEIEPYAQAVLLSRMAEARLPGAPIWEDIRELKGRDLPAVDIIYGGFPCTDLSTANRSAKGLAGERSGLFFEIVRLAKEIRPQFLFLENVPALRTRGLDQVGEQLAEAGYDCRWCVVSASEVGAPHQRRRWFLLANANHSGSGHRPPGQPQRPAPAARREVLQSSDWKNHPSDAESLCSPVAYTCSSGLAGHIQKHEDGKQCCQKQKLHDIASQSSASDPDPWETESGICALVDGAPFRMEQIKLLGNGVVPKQAQRAFEILAGLT